MATEAPSVLVADDNEATRDTLALALRHAGYGVILAASARDAMACLAESPSVCAVLADVVMPETDGIELARRARALRPDLPIVLMTGHEDYVDSVSATGAIPLLKPFSASMLLRVLADCHTGCPPAARPAARP